MSVSRGIRSPRSGDHPVLVVAGSVVIIVVLCWILHLAGWWIFGEPAGRSGQTQRETFEFEQSSVDTAQNNISEIKVIDVQIDVAIDQRRTDLINERRARVTETCQLIAGVYGPLPADLQAFHDGACR